MLDRLSDDGVTGLDTTIAPTNEASQRLFASVARDRGLTLTRHDYIAGADIPGGDFLAEDLYSLR